MTEERDLHERLAAYAAGDVDASERARIEAELAADGSLRLELERIRGLDAALASLPPVDVPAAFSAGLRERIEEELRTAPVDELAARRARRALPRWVPAVAGAAALVAVVGIGINSLGGGRLGSGSEEADDSARTMAEVSQGDAAGPQAIRVTDASYDADSIGVLAEDATVADLLAAGLDPVSAQGLRDERLALFGYFLGDGSAVASAPAETDMADEASAGGVEGESAPAAGADDATSDEGAEAASEPQGSSSATGATAGELLLAPEAEARRCLDQILEVSPDAIPVIAEIASFEDEPAIIYALLTEDPDTGRFDRVELWVVARSDCQVLHFTQQDR